MDVLNAGKIELVDFMGSDLSVSQAARISNGAAMPEWRGAADERLIEFLAENDHLTPFEHSVFKFYVKAPIFVFREWQRHRTFSYNELSARYKKLKTEFFYPTKLRVPDPGNKQSSIESGNEFDAVALQFHMAIAYDEAERVYEELLDQGVARELARSVLPVGTYSEMYVTGNFRNWMHFIDLRIRPGAQKEIRDYAGEVLYCIAQKMPLATAAFERKYKFLQ